MAAGARFSQGPMASMAPEAEVARTEAALALNDEVAEAELALTTVEAGDISSAEAALAEIQAELMGGALPVRRPYRLAGRGTRPAIAAVEPKGVARIKVEFPEEADDEALELQRPALREEASTKPSPKKRKKGQTNRETCPECHCSFRHNRTCSVGERVGMCTFTGIGGTPYVSQSDLLEGDAAVSCAGVLTAGGDAFEDVRDDAEVRESVVAVAAPQGARAMWKTCKSCGAGNKRGKANCTSCGMPFAAKRGPLTGKHKEERRAPCRDCDTAIAEKKESCPTCGSICEFRAKERAARARLAEGKALRKKRAAQKRKMQEEMGNAAFDDDLLAEQERLFSAAAARHAQAP